MPIPSEMWGYPLRVPYGGEARYFRENPGVAGMASGGAIVLNPGSGLSDVEKMAVMRNEAARLHMGERGYEFDFGPTGEQEERFRGTAYGLPVNRGALLQTILARGMSGDASAGGMTERQRQWVEWLMGRMRGRGGMP